MIFDRTNKIVYIATAINQSNTVVNYAIERFKYDPSQIGVNNTKVLTRLGQRPFFTFGSDTKCISGMFIGE